MSSKAPSSGGRIPDEVSAGGVVIRGAQTIVIVPKRRAADGKAVLGLPKGHVDRDETPEQAAQREVREEAGVQTRLIEKLGDVRYYYQRDGRRIAKLVSFFMFEYLAGDPSLHDHEIEEARWMDLSEAALELSYEGERKMAARALSLRGAAR